MEKVERFIKAYEHLKGLGIVHKRKDVAERMNVSEPNISRVFSGNPKYLTDRFLFRFNNTFDNVFNYEWLKFGTGDMLRGELQRYATSKEPKIPIVMESVAPYGEPAEEEVNITEADTIIAMQRMMEIDRVRKMLIAEKDREIEALTKELEFWKAKANKLEYELSKTKTDTDTLQEEKAV